MAEAVAERLSWASQDPRSGQYVAYSQSTCRRIEQFWREQREKVDILVELDSGVRVCHVYFVTGERGEDRHIQRTASGTGERPVVRVAGKEDELALPDGTLAASVTLSSVMWVSLDPVAGTVVPYQKDNAVRLELAYRSGQRQLHDMIIILPNGSPLMVTVQLPCREKIVGVQRTGTGERHIRRIVFEQDRQIVTVPTKRLPADMGVDSQRYRFVVVSDDVDEDIAIESASVQCGPDTIVDNTDVPEFATLLEGEEALAQLGVAPDLLRLAEERLKSEGFRIASAALLESYQTAGSDVPLTWHLEAIGNAWLEHGLLDHQMCPGPLIVDPPLHISGADEAVRGADRHVRRGATRDQVGPFMIAAAAACYKKIVLLDS